MLPPSRGRGAVVLPLLVALTACGTARPLPATVAPRRASATLLDAAGRAVGTVQLVQGTTGGVVLAGDLHDLPAGPHGMHLHAVGSCDTAAGFAGAGGHINPAGRRHGLDTPDGPHAGDLPSVVVGADGRGSFSAATDRVNLAEGPTSLLDADGSAIVLHAAADDQRTDPSGNSGARIACGVVRAASR